MHKIPNINVNKEKLIFLVKSNNIFNVKIPKIKANINATHPPSKRISGFLNKDTLMMHQ